MPLHKALSLSAQRVPLDPRQDKLATIGFDYGSEVSELKATIFHTIGGLGSHQFEAMMEGLGGNIATDTFGFMESQATLLSPSALLFWVV